MKRISYIVPLFLSVSLAAQTPGALSAAMAKTVMTSMWKDTTGPADKKPLKWTYDQGVVLKGIEGLWYRTGDAEYFNYIQHSMDVLITKDGGINTYKLEDYNIDNINCGRILLLLYRVTGDAKYYKAASTLREQLNGQPRTTEGGFWHKKRYPNQMWLDGLYMGEPFYTEYASVFHQPEAFDDIANQFIWMEKHARDPKTGLLYHGWDESKKEKWSDKTTGNSPNFWARAMGWYGMALVDVLDYFPANHPKRKELLQILSRYAKAVGQAYDYGTSLWWDVLDKPNKEGNYPEASASCMFVYTLAKAVRMRYLPDTYGRIAITAYGGITKRFTETDAAGNLNLKGTVAVSGLGGDPYRDGSYAYYVGEKVVVNDPKGVGAFLLASNEIVMISTLFEGKGKKVVLDYYFNNEWKKDITGQMARYHYNWEDEANSGFSLFGNVFQQYGASLDSLTTAPTAAGLKNADVYIITDPDTDKETAKPNYASAADASAIYDWVKAGGVLLLLMNDSGNCEFTHFNQIPEKFGIHFNEDSRNKVIGHEYATGSFPITVQDAIFKTTKKIYIKEISTLKLTPPAKAHFTDGHDVIIAVSKVGKGTVFAVGDPWFYNEYLDGRKLPAEYDNYDAARDLVKWLLEQVPSKTK